MNSNGKTRVSDADHVRLERLVTEAAWRVDEGRSDALYELFVEDGMLLLGRQYRHTLCLTFVQKMEAHVATMSGRPSSPARTNDAGVPPAPSQIGSGFCTGRG